MIQIKKTKIVIFLLLIIILDNNKVLFYFFNNKIKIKNNTKPEDKIISKVHSNINLNDEFIKMNKVQKQIKEKNLTYIETLQGVEGNVGNALIMLNNLINICEKINCKNIILRGLYNIIKNPIFYKKYNITIFPVSYKNRIKIDIKIQRYDLFRFHYKKNHNMRLNIIRNEIFHNIPIYKANPNDLYINIRSGDIFVNKINIHYWQPPLCFYQKIINNNRFRKLYLLSNGHENPVVDELLKLYNKIKYIHGSVEYDISVIVNAYNFVMPTSTFPKTLIYLNYNIKNLYIYGFSNFNSLTTNCSIHRMIPSPKFMKIMWNKWKNNSEQYSLLLKEDCINRNMTSYYPNYKEK